MLHDSGDALRRHVRGPGRPAPGDAVAPGLRRLCVAAVADLGVRTASVVVMGGDGVATVAATSRADDRRLTELELDLGEGPCRDVAASRRPVLEPDLERSWHRWPVLAQPFQEAGVCGVAAFPLAVGAVPLGVLVLYAARRGSAVTSRAREALVYAEVATETLLDAVGDAATTLAPGLDGALRVRGPVFQAQGMVMVDLGVSLADALLLLRGQAFATGRPLGEVAGDVVAGRLRLVRPGPTTGREG